MFAWAFHEDFPHCRGVAQEEKGTFFPIPFLLALDPITGDHKPEHMTIILNQHWNPFLSDFLLGSITKCFCYLSHCWSGSPSATCNQTHTIIKTTEFRPPKLPQALTSLSLLKNIFY